MNYIIILLILFSKGALAYDFACNVFPPLKMDTHPPSGINVDTLNYILQNENLKIHFLPWQRALKDVRNGKYHGLCSCSKTVTRNFLLYTDPLGYVETGVFYQKKIKPKKKLEDFKGTNIATVRGYRIDNELTDLNVKHLRLSHEKQLLKMLKTKRVDAIYGYLEPIRYQMKLLGISRKDFQYLKISTDPYYICLSRKKAKNKELLQKINRGLRKLKNSGDYKKIQAKYLE